MRSSRAYLESDYTALAAGVRCVYEGVHSPHLPDLTGALWEVTEKHGLGGFIGCQSIRQSQPDAQPQHAAARYYTNMISHERSKRVCAKVAEAARAESIGVAVLKGPALVEQAYGDGGLRGYGDIDLFVGSRDEALRLLAKLKCSDVFEKGVHGLSARLREPGKIAATLDGVTLELMYAVSAPTDPMQALLERHREALLTVPDGVAELLDPDPGLHFVFLILHMAVNHMVSRLIWYWDLAMLVQAQRARIDPQWIARELEALQVVNLACSVSRVCQRDWDIVLPVPVACPGWNQPFLRYATKPEVVLHRRLNVWGVSTFGKLYLRTVHGAALYLLCDPQVPNRPYAAKAYTRARLQCALPGGFASVKRWVSSLLLPLPWVYAHLLCWWLRATEVITERKKDKRYEIAAKKV